MPLIRRGSAKHKHDARRAWLSARPELYAGVPGLHDDVDVTGRLALDALHLAMRAQGLFGASDVNTQRDTIRRLVSELRGERVGETW